MIRPLSLPLAAAALCAATFAAPVRAAEDPIAFLVAMKGKVEVFAPGSRAAQRGALGRPLMRGDRVGVGVGGKASLFFSDGNVIELGERSSITVSGKLPAKKPGTPGLTADVFQSVSKGLVGGSRETGLVALAPMRGGDTDAPLLLSPRRSDVLDARPVFTWRRIEGATRHRVSVHGEHGEIWSAEVVGNSAEYPADAPALPADSELLWEVQAFAESGPLRKEETVFRVLAPAASEVVRAHVAKIQEATGGAESEASRFMTATYLAGQGLYSEAVRHFESLCALAPGSPGPHEALGHVYQAVGLMDLAAAEFQRALALSREP